MTKLLIDTVVPEPERWINQGAMELISAVTIYVSSQHGTFKDVKNIINSYSQEQMAELLQKLNNPYLTHSFLVVYDKIRNYYIGKAQALLNN